MKTLLRTLCLVLFLGLFLGIDAQQRDTAGTRDRLADFSRAMAELKPRERAMLWLAYAEGASHREIAATLGLGEGSLRTLLFRARKKLALLLGVKR